MNYSIAYPRAGEMVLKHALTTVADFFEEFSDVSGNERSITTWFRSRQRLLDVDRIVTALLIILLVQWNIWFAGRFLLLTFKIVGKLAHLMLQILTIVIALAAVLGNFRHPLTRFISCVSLFLILRVHLGITSWLSLPSVILTLGALEHYLPGLLDGKELTDVAEAKKGELKELERRNSMAHTSQQKTSFRNVSYRS